MIVTLADLKSYLGVSGTDDDAWLTSQINIVQEAVERYCKRTFESKSYTETFYSDRRPEIYGIHLENYPVISVESITVDDADPLETTQYRLHKPSGKIKSINGWFFGCQTIVVEYTAGFNPVPAVIQDVVMSTIAGRYSKRSAGIDLNFGSDVQSIAIPGAIQINYDYSLSNNDRSTPFGLILGDSLNVLDAYRSHRAIMPDGSDTYVEVN